MFSSFCPRNDHLQGLLQGKILNGHQDRLIRHLDECSKCQGRLEELAAAPDDWPVLARRLGQADDALDSVLLEVMADLKDRDPATIPAGAPGAEERHLLSFLSPPAQPDHLGQLGHYQVTEIIGQGGMGIVLKAFDPTLHRFVAIKVLAPQLATSAAARKRFAREARAAAAVSHEHVVAIFAVNEVEGLPYLVMEYVPGMSLQERIDRTGPLELKEILRIGMQIAAGLGAAHAQGLVHRDIKPANVLLENGVERVKITDFGLARAVDDASVTQSGVLAGTPHYMAPEQARGEALDCRADLFSLGSVLYTVCTGRPPFRAGSTLAVLRRVSEETPRPVHEVNPEIPAWLADIIDRLHAKRPEDRFETAGEVATLLGQCLAHVQSPRQAPLPRRSGRRSLRRLGARLSLPAWRIPAALFGCLLLSALMARGWAGDRLRSWIPGWWHRQAILAMHVEDPNLNICIESPDQSRQFTGSAHQEISLPVGKHRVRATMDDKLVYSELVALRPGEHRKLVIGCDKLAGCRAHLLEQGDQVWAAVYSPNGATLATVGGHEHGPGELRLWDTRIGRERAAQSAVLGIRSVAFAPSGELIATGEFDNTARLRRPDTGEVIHTLQGHQGGVNCVAFAPDGQVLATAGLDGQVKLWDVATGTVRLSWAAHQGWVLSLAFAPDGKTLATSGSDHQARLWDLPDGTPRATLAGHENWVEAVAFSPDGTVVATASWDSTVKFWATSTGSELSTLPAQMCEVYCLAFAPVGGQLATGGADGIVRIWDLHTARQIASLPAHANKVYSVAYSPDGKSLVSSSWDGSIKIWDLEARLPHTTPPTPTGSKPGGNPAGACSPSTSMPRPEASMSFPHPDVEAARWPGDASGESLAAVLSEQTARLTQALDVLTSMDQP